MLADGLIDAEGLERVWAEAAGGAAELDEAGFQSAVFLLDAAADEGAEEGEDQEDLREAFEGLSAGGERVGAEAFLAWDEVRALVAEGRVSEQQVRALLAEAGPGGLDLAAFGRVVDALDAAAGDDDEAEEEEEGEDEAEEEEEGEDEAEEEADATWEGGVRDEEVLRDLFDELRSPRGTVSVQLFLKWTELDALFRSKVLDDEVRTSLYALLNFTICFTSLRLLQVLDVLLTEVGSSRAGQLTFDQFKGDNPRTNSLTR